MKVTFYGSTGNCGKPTLPLLLELDFIEKITIMVHNQTKTFKKLEKKYKDKLVVIKGNLGNIDDVRKTIGDSDIVINMAAVIPPKSDKHHDLAVETNITGVNNIIKVIEEKGDKQPKLIHFSSIACYGDRNEKHLWLEAGDPLLPSPFDVYAVTKVRGEYAVLESNIKNWAVLRQTAVIYDELLMKNVSDGLMFHTAYNCPLEWVTAQDSAVMVKNLLIRENKKELNEKNFWKHIFNIGTVDENKVTGYDFIESSFAVMGASMQKVFDPGFNAYRNFHGEWFSDGYKLNDLFDYQKTTLDEYWKQFFKKKPIFKLAKICPSWVIRKLVIEPLRKDSNAPAYWYKKGNMAQITAYFGSKEKYDELQSFGKDWSKFPLLCKGKNINNEDVDYDALRKNRTRVNHHWDFDKADEDIDINDLKTVAEAHGGKLITEKFEKGDIYNKVLWENQDGVRFEARPFSILRGGHWMQPLYTEFVWDYDRLAKKDKIMAEVWYDAHKKDENHTYYLNENEVPCMKDF